MQSTTDNICPATNGHQVKNIAHQFEITLAAMATCKPAKSTLMYVGPSTTMHSNLIYNFSVKRVQTMSMLQFPQVSLLIRLTVHLNFSHISRFHGLLSPSLRCCSRISSHQIIGIPTPPCVLLYFPVKTPANPI